MQEFTNRRCHRRNPLQSSGNCHECVLSAAGAGALAFESFQSFVSLAQATEAIVDPTVHLGRYHEDRPRRSERISDVDAGASRRSIVGGRGWFRWLPHITAAQILRFRGPYSSRVPAIRHGYQPRELGIETAMEMTTKEGATLPERWIDGACAGLFQADNKKETEVISLAALGAVMGLGPEVTVGPTGASFKIPPKAAKKAANDAE